MVTVLGPASNTFVSGNGLIDECVDEQSGTIGKNTVTKSTSMAKGKSMTWLNQLKQSRPRSQKRKVSIELGLFLFIMILH